MIKKENNLPRETDYIASPDSFAFVSKRILTKKNLKIIFSSFDHDEILRVRETRGRKKFVFLFSLKDFKIRRKYLYDRNCIEQLLVKEDHG